MEKEETRQMRIRIRPCQSSPNRPMRLLELGSLDTYNIKFMKTGESGPIRFHLVSCDSEEEIVSKIVFGELELAIVQESPFQRFRRCFKLVNDFSWDTSFTISTVSSKEADNYCQIAKNPSEFFVCNCVPTITELWCDCISSCNAGIFYIIFLPVVVPHLWSKIILHLVVVVVVQ